MSGKRVVVVGSGPVLTRGLFQEPGTPRTVARFIDGSDVVIRMNNLKNFGAPGAGTKTDIHVVTNTGKPGRRYARKVRLDARILRGAREIWFGSDPALVASHEQVNRARPDADAEKDWVPEIVARQRWGSRRWKYIPADVVRRLREELGGSTPDPSLGPRVIAAALADERFADHTVYLFGFGFFGSKAHDWDAERAYVERLREAGRIGIAPGDPEGASFPHERASLRARRWSVLLHPRTVCRLRGRRLWPLNF